MSIAYDSMVQPAITCAIDSVLRDDDNRDGAAETHRSIASSNLSVSR